MKKPAEQNQNQGEGNRSADREYREGATKFADTPEQKRAAEAAERSIDDEDDDEEGDEDEEDVDGE